MAKDNLTEAEKNEQLQRSELKSKCEAAGKAYKKMLDPVKEDKVPEEYRYNAKRQFILEYKDVVEDYLADPELSKESINEGFADTVTLYKQIFYGKKEPKNLGSPEAQEKNKAAEKKLAERTLARRGTSELIYDTMKENGLAVTEDSDVEDIQAESHITGAQKTGLKDISQWMLRNMDKTGIAGDSKGPFVRGCVLRQPARVKLCAYYLVETDARKLSGEALQKAVAESQKPSYVPNLTRFKDKMIASKFKFWKRFTGDQFYWHKLSESMRYAIQAKPVLMRFGELGPLVVTEADATPAQDGALEQQNDSMGSGAGTPAKKEKKLNSSYEIMLKCRDDIVMLLDKKEKSASGGEWTSKDARKLERAQEGFLKHSIETVKQIEAGEVESFEAEDGKISEVNEKIGLAGTAVGVTASGLSNKKVGKAIDWVADLFDSARISSYMETGGNWISSGTSVLSFASIIVDIVRWAKKDGYSSHTTKIEEAASFFSQLTEVANQGLETYMGIKGIEETSALGLQMTGWGNLVTGGVAMAVGATTIATKGRQRTHLTDSQNAINANKDIGQDDKRKTNDLIELQRRNLKLKQNQGGAAMVSGALNVIAGVVALTGLGAPLAAVFSAAASVISLFSSVWAFFKKKSNKLAAIDAYIQMDRIFPGVSAKIKETCKTQNKTGKDAGKSVEIPSDDDIKQYIRLEAAANLCCYSTDDLYNYLTREYAELIYSKVFYKDDGKTPITYKDGKPELSETNKQYADLLKGFGLKAKYDKDKPRPTVLAIQKRMRV